MSAKISIKEKVIRPAHVVFSKKDVFFPQKSDSVIASKSTVNICITYRLSSKPIRSSNALKNSLFGATKVIKPNSTTDPHKYDYSEYGIAFDLTGQITHPDDRLGKNVMIFGADLSNSRHITNKTQDSLILGKTFVQKINDTTISAEKTYSPNFSVENKIFVLRLHYNGDNSYLFVNDKKVTQFKAKDSEIKASQLALGIISITPNLSSSDI